MKITNKHNLPRTIINAVERDPYTKGNARISVTGLLKPPRIGLLWHRYNHLMERDVSDMIWALMGQAIHAVLERGGDEEHIPEERLFIEVRGWRVSGQLDVQKIEGATFDEYRITDYKSTSAYAVMSEKPDWEKQLNCYAHLLRENGRHVESLHICALVRDWNRHRAAADSNYPQAPMVMLDIPLWGKERAAEFIEQRVRIHQAAQADADMGISPPPCTDDERWMRRPSYAVMKAGNKKASKVFDNAEEATAFVKEKGASFYIETRHAEPIRCTGDYCGVAPWCEQFREWKEKQDV